MPGGEDATEGFVGYHERELSALAKAVASAEAADIAGAGAALLLKVLTGSSILAGAAEKAVAKAFGHWFADTPDARLKKAAEQASREDGEHARLRQFAELVKPYLDQGQVQAREVLAELVRGQRRPEASQREGFDTLAAAMWDALDHLEQIHASTQRIERRLEDGFSELKAELGAWRRPRVDTAPVVVLPPSVTYDVFFSYAHADQTRARPIVDALRVAGLKVWFDEDAIETFERITASIQDGIACSKVLVAFYSATYPQRRACQWELTAAYVAGQSDAEGVHRRVLVINPEASVAHIEPITLRDPLFAKASDDEAGLRRLARTIAERSAALDAPLGVVKLLKVPSCYGALRPRSSRRFVGRLREMWAVHSALHAQDSAVIAGHARPDGAQIVGMGGNGKSLLAEEYALRFGAAYPGGIFWISAYGNDGRKLDPGAATAEFDAQFISIAEQLPETLRFTTHGLNPAQVRRELEHNLQKAGAPCLWIVDDLPSGLSREQFDAWLPRAAVCKTLVTTRTHSYRAWSEPVDLSVLPANEAMALFSEHLEQPCDRGAVEAIVDELGYHALAVDVAGAYAKVELTEGGSLTDILRALLETDGRILEDNVDLGEQLPNGHEKSILQTLRLSIERVGRDARDVLRIASWLAAAPIPVLLIDQVLGDVDGMALESGRQRGRRGRQEAYGLSLLERADGNVLVHGLVQRSVKAIETDPVRLDALRASAVRVLGAALSVLSDGRAAKPLAFWVVHARELVGTRELSGATLDLLDWVARCDHASGEFVSARAGWVAALQARTRLLGPEHPDTLTSRSNLAATLKAQGELGEARTHQEAVLEAWIRLLGTEHPITLTSRNNLAFTLKAQGELGEARRHQEAVLEARTRMLGPEHRDTLTGRTSLASTLKAQGKLADARGHEEAVLEAQTRLQGPEHPDTLTGRNNLALTLKAQGELADARGHEEAVLEAQTRLQGPEHPDTLTSRNNFALTLFSQGELAEARVHQEAVLEAQIRLLGPEHLDTLTSRSNLAFMLATQGELGKARGHQGAVLEARTRLLGPDHPDTLGSRNNLALTLFSQGELAAARGHQEAVLEAWIRLLGPAHPDTLTGRSNLARTLSSQGELAEARGHQEAVLEARTRLLGPDHPDTVTSRNNLALTLFSQGELGKALGHQEAVLEAWIRLQGPEHPGTLTSRNNLASMLFSQGELAKARGHQEAVLEAQTRLLGPEHPDTLRSRNNLALTLFSQGERAGARGHQEAVLEVQTRLLGPDHPDTLTTRNNLAFMLQVQDGLGEERRSQRVVDA